MMNGFIYIIKNTVNNKVYIGQTSRTIEARYHQHLRTALNNYGDSGSILYNAIRKYGADKFYVEELEEVNVDLLNERERYWINKYNSIRPNGYNIREGGDDSGRKEVYQIDINTNQIIQVYASAMDAAEKLKLDLSHLTKVCRHEYGRCSCGGFKWSYAENYESDYIEQIKPKVYERPVCQVNAKTGELIKVWDNMRQASIALSIASGSINNCITGKYKTAGGFQWCNPEDLSKMKPYQRERKILQYDKNDNFVREWSSAKEVAKSFGCDASSIRKVARGKQKTAQGYVWKYKEEDNDK